MPRFSLATITLKRFIFTVTATFVVTAVTFLILIISVSWVFLKQAEDASAHLSYSISSQTHSSIFRAMGDGRTRQEMTRIFETYRRSFPEHSSLNLHVGRAPVPWG